VGPSDEPGRAKPDERGGFRFFTQAANADREAARAADVDYADTYGLVAATRGEGGQLVGHGLYVRGPGETAEVAFAIADQLQGQGLGTIMLAHLAEAAVVSPPGAVAVDARVRVETAPPRRPWPSAWAP
jgi:GNAT superfamily N-acetyltransferase